jgi:hypothetical protein
MNLLSQLSDVERTELLEGLNYMNLEEIRGFCSARHIPYRVAAEYPDGKVRITKDADRKPIVLARIRDFLVTGRAGAPTRIPAAIVREDKPPSRPAPHDRLYYRWYAKEFEGVMRLLRDLTDGRFRDGAVARVVAMDFWTRGQAPTIEQFARAWTKAKTRQDRMLTPEYAYLTDLRHRRADRDWKAVRTTKAAAALRTLARIAPIGAARNQVSVPGSAVSTLRTSARPRPR